MNDLSNYHSQEQIIAELKEELKDSKAEVKKLTARLEKEVKGNTARLGKLKENQEQAISILKRSKDKSKSSMVELKAVQGREFKRLCARLGESEMRVSELTITRTVKDGVIASEREKVARIKAVYRGMLTTKVKIASRIGAGDRVVDIIKDLGVSSTTIAVINKLIKGDE